MCHRLTPESSIGEGDDNSSIHVAISSTYTEQQIASHGASARSAAASSIVTPEPTPTKPTRRLTRSFAAWERTRELELHPAQPQQQRRPARLHFDDSFVPDMVTDPNATSPVHGTKRMRSFEEMMSETHTPEKDKMAEDIDKLEETTKRADGTETAGGERAFRTAKRARIPIRNSPRMSGSDAKSTSRGGVANGSTISSSQEGGSQDSQPSQFAREKS